MIERLSGDFIQWLRAFYYVESTGSVSGAAERMELRQPTVSYLLQALERDLGSRLFRRTGKTMRLTPEGEKLKVRCGLLFDLIREIRAEASQVDTLSGEISLATIHTVGQNYLADKLAAFSLLHPDVTFRIFSATEINVALSHILSSDLDMGVVPGGDFPPALTSQPLFSSRLVLAVSRRYSFERGWVFDVDEQGFLSDLLQINNLPFICFSSSTHIARYIEAELKRAGATPKIVATANNSTLLMEYAKAGLGLTILDDVTLSQCADQFTIYPLRWEKNVRTNHLVTRSSRYLPPQSVAFIEFLAQKETKGLVDAMLSPL